MPEWIGIARAPPPENMDLVRLTLASAARLPDRPALIDASSGTVTCFADLANHVKRSSASLSKMGFRPGHLAATLTPNTPHWVIFALAVWGNGGAVTGINPALKPDEIARQLKATGARILAVASQMLAIVAAARLDELVDEVIVLDDGQGQSRYRTLAGLIRDGRADLAMVAPATGSLALLPFSSGTGGLPKAVEVVAGSLSRCARLAQQIFDLDDHDVLLAVTPFFHIAAVSGVLAPALALGLPAVIVQSPSPEAVLQAIAQYRVTMSIVTPPIIRAFATHPAVDALDLSSLRIACCTAAPLAADVQRAAALRLGSAIVQVYAMTESVAPITCSPLGDPRPGSVGKAAPGVGIRIVEPNTAVDCGPGAIGEIWFRSPHAMRGYCHDPAADAAIRTVDGWTRTGDLGCMDADGYLTIVGRLKELIKVGGAQVAPAEIEAVIAECPGVADVAVAGRPDARAGERPVAYVVRSQPITAETILAWTAERLATFKQPASVEFVELIPRQPTGKIMRRLLPGQSCSA